MLVPLTAVCLMAAAQSYQVPAESLYSILRIEGGSIGSAKPNRRKDGSIRSVDLGPFQVNTSWVPTFARYWNQPDAVVTYEMLRDDGCAGAYAAAAIVRYHWDRTGSLDQAIAFYHTGPKGDPTEMAKYLARYREIMRNTFSSIQSQR